MAKVSVKCPTCDETQVYKYGKDKNGTQKYLCHAEGCPTKTFRLEYIIDHIRNQLQEHIANDQISMKELIGPFTGEKRSPA